MVLVASTALVYLIMTATLYVISREPREAPRMAGEFVTAVRMLDATKGANERSMVTDIIQRAFPTVTNITPPGLLGGTASGGFVRGIAVDPTNSNVALLAFGNYNFPSLWYTTNGGTSWTDVEGNLLRLLRVWIQTKRIDLRLFP